MENFTLTKSGKDYIYKSGIEVKMSKADVKKYMKNLKNSIETHDKIISSKKRDLKLVEEDVKIQFNNLKKAYDTQLLELSKVNESIKKGDETAVKIIVNEYFDEMNAALEKLGSVLTNFDKDGKEKVIKDDAERNIKLHTEERDRYQEMYNVYTNGIKE